MPDYSIFFDGPVPWIRVAHRIESPLKRYKDKLIALARRPFAGHATGR